MKRIATTELLLPEKSRERVICGTTVIEWYFAVVYVHNKQKPYDPPTHLHFSFLGSGDYYLDEVVALVDQWTFYRCACIHTYNLGDHEYYRARKMAIQVTGTYRRDYLKKHGSAPNPLGLLYTPDPDLAKMATERVNRRTKDMLVSQLRLDLDEPIEPRTA